MIYFNELNKGLRDPKVNVMNFLNEVTTKYPEAISFAPGRPLEKYFSIEKSFSYIERYIEELKIVSPNANANAHLGQYGETKGLIREIICELIKNDENIITDSENIIISVGSQEAMFICLLALAGNAGSVIFVANPSYVGITGAAKLLDVEIVPIPTNENGIILEKLVAIYDLYKEKNKAPKLLYLSPDFSNPTGGTMSLAQRVKLLDLTSKMDLIILEDNAYNYFYYSDNKIPCLKSLKNSQHVIYLGSFSKSIFPGLRIGFLVADQNSYYNDSYHSKLIDEITKVKSFVTVNSSPLNQAVVGGIILSESFSLKSHTKPFRDALRSNRDEMINALCTYFPETDEKCKGVKWNKPQGGFFISLSLPFRVTTNDLYQCAEKYGVIWTPMSFFSIDDSFSDSIRLSFSYVNTEQIRHGIKELSKYVIDRIANKEI